MSELDSKIGYLMVKKGMINIHQLTQALELQAKLNTQNHLLLGEILIQMGFATKNNVTEILVEQKRLRKVDPIPLPINYKLSIVKPNKTILKTEIEKKSSETPIVEEYINRSSPKISNSIYSEKSKHKPIGEILLEKSLINREQLSQALQYQSVLPPTHYKPVGEVLVELKFISRENLNLALGVQSPVSNNSLGEILKQFGLIDASKLAIVLTQQHSSTSSIPVGELLLQHGFITKEQLNRALEEQRRRNIK